MSDEIEFARITKAYLFKGRIQQANDAETII